MNIEVNEWVEVDRWPLASVAGQVTEVDGKYFKFVNFHGEHEDFIDNIIRTIDIEAYFADDPNGFPPFVAERIRLTA